MQESLKMYSKTQNIIKVTFLACLFLGLSHCKNNNENQVVNSIKKEQKPHVYKVDVTILKEGVFNKELVSNGRLVALEKSHLKFNLSEKLHKIYVKNGDYVKKNQVLATLNSFPFQQQLDKAKLDLKNATLEFKDLQVRRGFNSTLKDSMSIKEYERMAIKSGYKNALHLLEEAKYNLNSTRLTAPFNGKIANLSAKEFEYISDSSILLTLINDSVFEVEFFIIEAELKDVKINGQVIISPFASKNTYIGTISTINPQVEIDGTILVKAQVENTGDLLEGMNVKVFIQNEIPNQLVVPKEAVIIRDNQEVLFTVKNGKSYWTYIQTTLENSHQYAVIPHPNKSSASLKSGDTIIVSNNLNLAHDNKITIGLIN